MHISLKSPIKRLEMNQVQIALCPGHAPDIQLTHVYELDTATGAYCNL